MTRPSRAVPAPPGPRGHWLWGSLDTYARDPLAALTAARNAYGDVVRMRLGPATLYLVAHPDGVKHVLQERHASYRKYERLIQIIRPITGEGLFSSEGEHWLRQRRLMQPGFHRQRLAALGGTIVDLAARTAHERWPALLRNAEPPVVDIQHECMRLALEIVARALLGADVSHDVADMGEATRVVLGETERRINTVVGLPTWLPTPRNRRYGAAIATLERIVMRVVDERRRAGGTHDDLLSMLLEARDAETGAQMSDRHLRDEVMTLLLAGHETTAIALTWALHLLATHPLALARVHAELADALDGRLPRLDDLPHLPYTLRVAHEALRLYPPGWAIARVPTADDEVGGYRIPSGAVVVVSPFITHRHPTFWADPERFDPDRFAPDQVEARPRYAYFPFGGGPRLCIGQSFALLEIHLVLATLLQRWTVEPLPGHTVRLVTEFTLRPHGGLPLLLRPVAATSAPHRAPPAAAPTAPA